MLFSILKLFSSFVLFLSSRFFQTSPSLSLRYLKLSISKTNLILKNLWLNVCNTKLTNVIIFYVSISVAVLDSHYHCSFPGIVHLPAHKLCLLNSNVSFLTHPGNLFHTFHGFFLKKKNQKNFIEHFKCLVIFSQFTELGNHYRNPILEYVCHSQSSFKYSYFRNSLARQW